MEIAFSSSMTPSSIAVRADTFSKWSHCGIVTPDGTVIEAVVPRVREVSWGKFLGDNGKVQVSALLCANDAKAIEFARAQIGKPYDIGAIAGLGIHRDWRNPNRWFCSELVTASAEFAGTYWFRGEDLWRVTPGNLWMLAPANISCCAGAGLA